MPQLTILFYAMLDRVIVNLEIGPGLPKHLQAIKVDITACAPSVSSYFHHDTKELT